MRRFRIAAMSGVLLTAGLLANGTSFGDSPESKATTKAAKRPTRHQVDLKNSPAAKRAAEHVEGYLHGNEKRAKWDYLILDLRTGKLRGRLSLRNKQDSSVRVLGRRIPIEASWTTRTSFEFNPLAVHGHATIDFGHGIRIPVSEIAAILAALV